MVFRGSLNFCSCTNWFLDLDDLVRINRAWLYKDLKVLDLQVNVSLAQLVRHWTFKLVIISCIRSSPTGGNFFLLLLYPLNTIMPFLPTLYKLWKTQVYYSSSLSAQWLTMKSSFFTNSQHWQQCQYWHQRLYCLKTKNSSKNVTPVSIEPLNLWFQVQHSPFWTNLAFACKAETLVSLCSYALNHLKSKNQVVHEQKFKDFLGSTCQISSERRVLDLLELLLTTVITWDILYLTSIAIN